MKSFKKIRLASGEYTLVDVADYPYLSQFKWHRVCKPYYAAGRKSSYKKGNGRQRTILMHREILVAKPRQHVDHINHKPLDNRRKNLRIATHSQNMANRRTFRKYKGAHRRSSGNYQALIRVAKKLIPLGTFPTEKEAAKAYDRAAKKYFGKYAYLNFGGANA